MCRLPQLNVGRVGARPNNYWLPAHDKEKNELQLESFIFLFILIIPWINILLWKSTNSHAMSHWLVDDAICHNKSSLPEGKNHCNRLLLLFSNSEYTILFFQWGDQEIAWCNMDIVCKLTMRFASGEEKLFFCVCPKLSDGNQKILDSKRKR